MVAVTVPWSFFVVVVVASFNENGEQMRDVRRRHVFGFLLQHVDEEPLSLDQHSNG